MPNCPFVNAVLQLYFINVSGHLTIHLYDQKCLSTPTYKCFQSHRHTPKSGKNIKLRQNLLTVFLEEWRLLQPQGRANFILRPSEQDVQQTHIGLMVRAFSHIMYKVLFITKHYNGLCFANAEMPICL